MKSSGKILTTGVVVVILALAIVGSIALLDSAFILAISKKLLSTLIFSIGILKSSLSSVFRSLLTETKQSALLKRIGIKILLRKKPINPEIVPSEDNEPRALIMTLSRILESTFR